MPYSFTSSGVLWSERELQNVVVFNKKNFKAEQLGIAIFAKS